VVVLLIERGPRPGNMRRAFPGDNGLMPYQRFQAKARPLNPVYGRA
jgi:hypothetical protein